MLLQKLQSDQISFLKKGDKDSLTTVRYILAQIKNKEIEKRTELTDEDVIGVLRKQVKELNESITAFEKGGRADLSEPSKKQLALVSSYLPAEMSDEELKKEIEAIIAQNKELASQNAKALIGMCVGKLKSKVDPSRIVKLVQQVLPA